tara:strand:- start:5791 stop:6366 length:576 start_codon:yes stop_codon:yes gene_type:complete
MNHVWFHEQWKNIQLQDVKDMLLLFSQDVPCVGDISVRDICCLARNPHTPVGLYTFIEDNKVLYAGKTHGRSLHERLLSHLDHRDPSGSGPHLAQFAQSILKSGDVTTTEAAVQKILDMKMIWLPVPMTHGDFGIHKKVIASIERRLLWNKCLDPKYNSERVKRNDYFTIKGKRYSLSPDAALGEVSEIVT